ncbi:MAG: FIST C-terminal domain-containing protein [Acetobacteraceae bacterium]|nr:FIST C-terminal domain-containing protein [Acetobacteraceae bacterium]MBV8522737.1 FIST C-terminal domain-containing protein [Acetobacteraceae bacterium]
MTGPSGIRRGFSQSHNPAEAVRELHAQIAQPDPGLVVFFCSANYNLDSLATEIARHFPREHTIGCTTAGEITPIGYLDHSLTGFSIPAAECCAVAEIIPEMSAFRMPRGHGAAEAAVTALARLGHSVDQKQTFAMLLSDGLSTNEEALLASIHERIDNIPLAGGSAGDGLRLKQTFVYHGGRFHQNAALLALVNIQHPFKIVKCQHYTGSNIRMVVTAADPAKRIVHEINAEPAAQEYARIVGVDVAALTPMMFAEFPVMVRLGGDYFVRSIQKTNRDGSLTFFCAIDEGVVLTLAQREDMIENLEAFFQDIRQEMGPPQLVIGFDCILRSLEAEMRQVRHRASRILAANNVIGFSTYGEQFTAMHVNQTFTAVVIGKDRAR